MSNRTGLPEGKAAVLMLHLNELKKASDAAVLESDIRLREVRALDARVRMFCDKLYSLKRCKSANCDLELITLNVVDAQSDITNLATMLHRRSTVTSCDSIRCSVDEALVEISRRLIEAFDCEARNLQQGIREAVRAAAEGTWGPSAGASGAVDKSLGLIIESATSRCESARVDSSLFRTANQDASNDACSSRARSAEVPPSTLLPGLPVAHGFCDSSGCGL